VTVPLNQVFEVRYGNKFDANKAQFSADGVSFVSRSSKNLGIVGQVEAVKGEDPFEAGLLTVTLGGTYLLSTFVQPKPFYTAQNIKVLRPLFPMTFAEKLYYCECIRANRFRFSTHGREANRSIDSLLVPEKNEVPPWIGEVRPRKFELRPDHTFSPVKTQVPDEQELVRIDFLFEVFPGILVPDSLRDKAGTSSGFVPYMRPSKTQTTSNVEYVNTSKMGVANVYPRHTLYVSTNGQGSHTYSYVSVEAFVPNTDVSVLVPKRAMALQEKLFYAAVITSYRPLFSYGRKPKGERLNKLMVPLWAPKYVYEDDIAATIAATNASIHSTSYIGP